jgi:hypothetical protein
MSDIKSLIVALESVKLTDHSDIAVDAIINLIKNMKIIKKRKRRQQKPQEIKITEPDSRMLLRTITSKIGQLATAKLLYGMRKTFKLPPGIITRLKLYIKSQQQQRAHRALTWRKENHKL